MIKKVAILANGGDVPGFVRLRGQWGTSVGAACVQAVDRAGSHRSAHGKQQQSPVSAHGGSSAPAGEEGLTAGVGVGAEFSIALSGL